MSNFQISNNNSINTYLQICLVLALSVLALGFPIDSLAADTSGLTTSLCKIVTMLTGTVGQAIAMIALCALGIGIFLGKLSWPLALATAVGITFIFSSANIVTWLSGSTAKC